MDSMKPQWGSISAVFEGEDKEIQPSYFPLPSSLPSYSTNRSIVRKRRTDDVGTAELSNTSASSPSLTERAQKRLHREEPIFRPSYSSIPTSPRTVFGGREDFGVRSVLRFSPFQHPSTTKEGPYSSEDNLNKVRYPDQVNIEDAARISNFDHYEQQQQPLTDPSTHEDIHDYGASTRQARMESRRGRNTLPEAPFFAQSHGFTIQNSQFYACSGHGFNQVREQDAPSPAFGVIPRDELRTLSVICTREGSRFNSANRKGSDVVVQVFEGSEARELWQKTLTFSRRLVNAHALDIIGVSPTSADCSDPHYIVFDGAGSRNTHRVIASMLRKGAMEATLIGLRAVYGITSGLDYISKTILPLSDLGVNGFDVFSDDSGHTRLTFTSNALGSSTLNRQSLPDVEICNFLLRKIFNNANHTIHGDDADQHMKEEFTNSRRLTPQMESAGDPEISLVANTPEAAKRPPRREIIWSTFGFSESSLSYISQTYDNLIFNNDSIQLPRHLGHSIEYQRACSCEGYIREEITFTPDALRNAVLIYQQPSLNERCGLCGELLAILPPYAGASQQHFNPLKRATAPSASDLSPKLVENPLRIIRTI